MTKCAEMVWQRASWSSSPCSRKAGYGEDGKYCKQHARKHPPSDQDTVTLYAATWTYGMKFSLVLCQVFNVTRNSLVVKSAEPLVGMWNPYPFTTYPLDGREWKFFSTEEEAVQWGTVRGKEILAALLSKVENLQSEIAALQNIEISE